MNLIELKQVCYSIKNKMLLNNINLVVNPGEIVALIGPNGAGKTSLINVLANLNRDFQGQYLYNGKTADHINKKTFAKELAYLEQGAPIHWPLIARRVIELGRLPHQGLSEKLSHEDTQAIDKAIKLADCEGFLEQTVNTLSGGERLRILLARLFATEPTVILADEPTAALDPFHQLHTMEILQQHARNQGAVVVVLHDINLAARFCDRLIVLNEGNLIANDSVDNILSSNVLEEVYKIKLAITEHEGTRIISPLSRA